MGISSISAWPARSGGMLRLAQDGTAIAVAHNIVDRDNRIVAVDRQGKEHTCIYSSGGGGEILSLLDAEFVLPPDQIREFRVQSRPFERAEITNIALKPSSANESKAKSNEPEQTAGQSLKPDSSGKDADTDGDGLSDFQEIHKYRTDPKKLSTAGDGVSDGDLAAAPGVHLHDPVGRQGDAAGEPRMPERRLPGRPGPSRAARTSSSWR